MLRYKALQIIRTFSNGETKNFKLFLSSPYFNTSKKVAQLFTAVTKFSTSSDNKELTNEYLMNKVGTNSLSTLKNLFADLYPLCEKFIAQEQITFNSQEYNIQLISGLNAKCLVPLCRKSIKKLESELANQKEFHIINLLTHFQLENVKYNIESINKPISGSKDLTEHLNFFWKAHNYIFYFYFSNAINAYIMTLNISKQMNIDADKTKLGQFFNLLFPIDKIKSLFHDNLTIDDAFLRDLFELQWLYVIIRIDSKNMFENSIKYIALFKKVENKLHIDEKYNFYLIFNLWFPTILEHHEFEEHEFEFYDYFLENKGYKSSGHDYMSLRNFILLYTRGDTTGR